MKKLSLFSLGVLTSLSLLAQNQPQTRTEMEVKPRFGLKGGVNLATLEIDDDSQSNEVNTNNKTSFHAGVFANIPIGGMFRFQPEVVYSGQGTKYSTSGIGAVKGEFNFHYLNVPLMLQVQTNGGFFVEAGPQIGFLLKGENKIGNNEEDVKDEMKKTDFSAGVGLGYLSRIGLGLNGRYNLGFTNVWDNDASGDDAKLKNRVIQMGLVYHFGAHK